ncbi:MAG: S-layer homology domain-containing protein [Desulfotomaculaceae bacterium]|nr:S-layer homology domain-containing protein [Desulfotomaculaceae bacterium]
MYKQKKGIALVIALALVLCIVAATTAAAEENELVIPYAITGTVQADGVSVEPGGKIKVFTGAKEVGTGDIVPNTSGIFSAIAGKEAEDFGKPLSFVVVISGKEYSAKSTPSEIIAEEGGMKLDVVLKIVGQPSNGSGNGSSNGGSNEPKAPAVPEASPLPGNVNEGTVITLSTDTSSATIYYTIDGSSPAESNTRVAYSEPVVVNEDMTIKAVSYKNDKYSDEATFSYVVNKTNEPAKELIDMKDHWAVQTVQQLVSKGIISGYEDNTFRPENLITRAECSVILARALSLTDTANENLSQFSDGAAIPSWAGSEVAAVVEADLLKGYQEADGTKSFMPGKQVSRAELAVILSRVVEQKLGAQTTNAPAFTDLSQIPDWALDGVGVAAARGLVNGYPDGTFLPNKEVTRAEAATMIDRLLNVQ